MYTRRTVYQNTSYVLCENEGNVVYKHNKRCVMGDDGVYKYTTQKEEGAKKKAKLHKTHTHTHTHTHTRAHTHFV
jgi:hypothetical protein